MDCRTIHGIWKHQGNRTVHALTQFSPHGAEATFYSKRLRQSYWHWVKYSDIGFYDNNGNYTGFRLKSLK